MANAASQHRRRRRRAPELSLDDVLPVLDELGRHAAPVLDWSAQATDPTIRVPLRTALTEAMLCCQQGIGLS